MISLGGIQNFVIFAFPLVWAIVLHEVAHGWVAYLLGDKTAFMLGRLTTNPIKHIDPIGTVLVPTVLYLTGGFIFGWAKPVPVNDNALRNPRRDMALVALAGPCANFVMALFWAAAGWIGAYYMRTLPQAAALLYMGQAGVSINLVLGVLNLLPLPPLDGGRIVSTILPRRAAYYYDKLESVGFLILLALLATGLLSHLITPPVRALSRGLWQLFHA